MYINIEVTLQVNVEVIIIVTVKKRIIISMHQSIEEDKHVNFTQGPYFLYKWLMKNGTLGGGGKPHTVDSD